MEIKTINLPISYLKTIDILKKLGLEKSRSECIRNALERFLERELEFREDLENFENIMEVLQ